MAKVHDPADRQQLSALLDSNTSRNTRKQGRGRPCIGKRAMTPAERQRRTVGNSRQSFWAARALCPAMVQQLETLV